MDQLNPLRQVYSATYSNNPVFEFHVEGHQIMRRRSDDWINATHILKLVGYDKPARTRILEREVQKGTHEKIQGGYGKYQGTWVPLDAGRALAERNGVLDKLLPIFNFVPGNQSPPPAPKHSIATSNRPRMPRGGGAAARRASSIASSSQIVPDHTDPGQILPGQVLASQVNAGKMTAKHYDNNIDPQLQGVDVNTPEYSGGPSYAEEEILESSQDSTALRKRKREGDELEPPFTDYEADLLVYKDQLQDYCMTYFNVGPNSDLEAPTPPPGTHPDMEITLLGHTGLHLAACTGEVELMKDFIDRGASTVARSHDGETPLIYAGRFTNNYEVGSMDIVIRYLRDTIRLRDNNDRTVFHHIALLTREPHQIEAARSYMDTIISDLLEKKSGATVASILDMQDRQGDTALIIAARYGARKVAKTLMAHGASSHIENKIKDTADHYLLLHKPKKRSRLEITSSSPVLEDFDTATSRKRPRRGISSQRLDYRSAAAMAVSTKLTPMIMGKCEQLAAAYEDVLVAKGLGWGAARPFREGVDEDLTSYNQELIGLQFEEEKDVSRDLEEEELNELVRQHGALLEQEDNYNLNLVRRRGELQNGTSLSEDGSAKDQEVLELRESFQQALTTHRELVKKLVEAESIAHDRQPIYKKIVERALEDGEEKDSGEVLAGVLHHLEMATQRNGTLVL